MTKTRLTNDVGCRNSHCANPTDEKETVFEGKEAQNNGP